MATTLNFSLPFTAQVILNAKGTHQKVRVFNGDNVIAEGGRISAKRSFCNVSVRVQSLGTLSTRSTRWGRVVSSSIAEGNTVEVKSNSCMTEFSAKPKVVGAIRGAEGGATKYDGILTGFYKYDDDDRKATKAEIATLINNRTKVDWYGSKVVASIPFEVVTEFYVPSSLNEVAPAPAEPAEADEVAQIVSATSESHPSTPAEIVAEIKRLRAELADITSTYEDKIANLLEHL